MNSADLWYFNWAFSHACRYLSDFVCRVMLDSCMTVTYYYHVDHVRSGMGEFLVRLHCYLREVRAIFSITWIHWLTVTYLSWFCEFAIWRLKRGWRATVCVVSLWSEYRFSKEQTSFICMRQKLVFHLRRCSLYSSSFELNKGDQLTPRWLVKVWVVIMFQHWVTCWLLMLIGCKRGRFFICLLVSD